MRRRRAVTRFAFGAALATAACVPAFAQDMAADDPLEDVNRGVQGFNSALAEHVVAPMADAVESNAPDEDSTGGDVLGHVGNVLDNLGEPKNALNGALQGNVGTLGTAIARFGINSTVGLLGAFDVAGEIGIEERKEDFGQTLGSWGAPSGPYMVAPIAGPTTARDVAGTVVDTVINPVGLLAVPGSEAISAARTGRKALNAADSAQDTADATRGEEDAYDLQRQMYMDRRDAQIANADLSASRQIMAPIEHREDRPGAPAAAAASLRGDGAADAAVSFAPPAPPVIEIYPTAPDARPATGEPTRLAPN